jgi:hypothetical protein
MSKRSDLFWDKLAQELGNITIEWSRVEKSLDELVGQLARLEEGHVAAALPEMWTSGERFKLQKV